MLHGSSALMWTRMMSPPRLCRTASTFNTSSIIPIKTVSIAAKQPRLPSQQQQFSSSYYRNHRILPGYCKTARLSYLQQQGCRRRWSSTTTKNGKSGSLYTPEQRKQDHKHCVEMVQTRDMEGYCKFILICCYTPSSFMYNLL